MRQKSDSCSSSGSNVASKSCYQNPSRRLYIANIDSQMDPKKLKKELQRIGQIENFFVKPPIEGRDTTFGFVSMSSIQVAELVINYLCGKKLCDRSLFVKYARPKPEQSYNERHYFKDYREREERRSRDQGERRFRGDKRDRSHHHNHEEKPRYREERYNQRERHDFERRAKYIREEDYQGRKNFSDNRDYKKKKYDSKHEKPSLEETQVPPKSKSKVQRIMEDFDY